MYYKEKNPLKSLFKEIKEELNEHLNAINQNTNEIQSNYEYLCELDNKIEKLREMLDELLLLKQEQKKQYQVDKLTRIEQKTYLALYLIEEEKGAATYIDIAKKLGITLELAQSYILSLIEKGIPIQKRYINNTPFLTIDPDFKSLQTKQNILQIPYFVMKSL